MHGVRDSTSELFNHSLQQALKTQSSFAYETNFHSQDNINFLKKAKEKDFETRIIYLTLKSEELAIQRVTQRVNEGGHYVAENTIRERYKLGLKNLDNFYDIADKVYIKIPRATG